MNLRRVAHCLMTLVCFGLCACSEPPPESTGDDWSGPKGNWKQVFFDDFNGPAGTLPNAESWNPEINGTPDNQEKEYYTNRPSNIALDGSGHLVIQALREHYAYGNMLISSQPFTSARSNTQGRVEVTYGRIEARIKLPVGKGLWPAFWLLGNDIDVKSVGWPACGELDVFELAGSKPSVITGSMHGPGYSGGSALSAQFNLSPARFADDYHLFALEWSADGVRWLVDERVYHSRTRQGMADIGKTWVFDHPFFMILNLAVGGTFDGDPDPTTEFPSQMLVDYVRVSQAS